MAAESRVTAGDTMYECDDKIVIVGSSLIGCAGEVPGAAKFMKWLEHPVGEAPEFTEDSLDALVINADGFWHYGDSHVGTKMTQPFYACGTGSMAAMAAMHCGKTPAEAVAIAIMCDKNSGGRIHVYDFNNGKPKRRK